MSFQYLKLFQYSDYLSHFSISFCIEQSFSHVSLSLLEIHICLSFSTVASIPRNPNLFLRQFWYWKFSEFFLRVANQTAQSVTWRTRNFDLRQFFPHRVALPCLISTPSSVRIWYQPLACLQLLYLHTRCISDSWCTPS